MSFFRNSRWWKLLALSGLLLAWAAPAFAGGTLNPAGGNAWELYVFGNGQVVYAILNSVSAMVGDPGYHDLLEFVGVLGIFGAAIVSGFDASKMPRMLAFVIGAFIVLYTSLDVTANIMVEDPVTNYTNVATGVPAVVGVPAAVISDIGHWLTNKVEQDFSLPNDLTVSGGDGFNLANSLTQAATQAQILDPYLRNSFSNYVQNCVIPELANGTMNADTLLNSTDMWAAMQTSNQAVLTPYYSSNNPNGTLVPCTTAYSDITGALTQDSQALLTANSNQWGPAGASLVANELTSALSFLSNNTVNQPADQAILQAATINMFNSSALQQGAALTGNNGMMISMALAQATQSQVSSWYTGAQIFNSLMGYIYSVLQAFLFAITPILFAALLIPGFGFAILKNFTQVLLWLILWQPMLAIVNYIMSLYGQQAYGGVLATAGGFTDMNLPVISEQASHMALAAGFLGTMVPMIAWGLVKGSLAFSDFIMSAGGGAFASQAAQQAASGNVTLDNQSMNNDSFNSKNFTHSLAVGESAMDTTFGLGAVNHDTQLGGSSLTDAAGAINDSYSSGTSAGTGTSSSQGTSSGMSLTSGAGRKVEAALQKQKALNTAAQVTHQALSKLSANQAQTAAEQATSKTLDQVSASSGNKTAEQTADATFAALEAQADALGLLGSGFRALAGREGLTGAEKTAVGRAVSEGKNADDIVSASGGKLDKAEAERLLAQRTKNLEKLKNDKNLQARIAGYLQSAKKWAEKQYQDPAVRKTVEAAAVVAVAGSMLLGVGEVAAAVGGLVELGEGTVAAADAMAAGDAAGAAAAAEGTTTAAEGAAEGAAEESGEAAEGSGEAENSTEPGKGNAKDSKTSQKTDKPAKSEKGKEKEGKAKGNKDNGLIQALSAMASKGSFGARITNTNTATREQSVTKTGSTAQDTSNSAGSSQTVNDTQEQSQALQNTLQALKATSQTNKSSIDMGLQELRKADRTYSSNQNAEIKNTSARTRNVSVGPTGSTEAYSQQLGAAELGSGNRSNQLFGPSQTAAARSAIAQAQAEANGEFTTLNSEVGSGLSPAQRQYLENLMPTLNPTGRTGASAVMNSTNRSLSAQDQQLVGRIAGIVENISAEYNGYNKQALSGRQLMGKVQSQLHAEGINISNAELMPLMADSFQELFNKNPTNAPGYNPGRGSLQVVGLTDGYNLTNPGDITRGDEYLVFSSREEGIAAAAETLEGGLYSNLTVGQVVERYEGYQPTPYADLSPIDQHIVATEAARNGMAPQAFLNKQNSDILQHVRYISKDMGVNPNTPFNQANENEVADLTSQLLLFENGKLNRDITPQAVKQALARYQPSLGA